MKSVTLIIPTFNRPQSLFSLLNDLSRSFINSNLFHFNVLIGNNGSHFSILKKYQFPVQLINNARNIGGASNVLKLVMTANSDFIMTMGDDDLIKGNFFRNVEFILNRPLPFGGGFFPIEAREDLNDFNLGGQKYKLMMRGFSLSGLIFNGKVRDKLNQEMQDILAASHYPQLGLLLLCADIGTIIPAPNAYIIINQNNEKYWEYDFSFFNSELFKMLKYINSRSIIDKKSWSEFIRQRARSLFISKLQKRSSLGERWIFVLNARDIPEFRYNKFFIIYSVIYVLLGWIFYPRRVHDS